ncbi:MAG: class I SAM-dependent RNA methyltransferase [Azospirillum sp.]|nr:class I SAM-dependent RNA methyltransferase [Azospirillum sp.]
MNRRASGTAVELTIEEIGGGGDGIARHGGQPVFVPFTVPGDRVRATLEARRGDGRAASMVALLEAGAGRAQPACRHFGSCGGCALQHLADADYAAWKCGRIGQALARAGFDDVPLAPLARTGVGERRRAGFAAWRRGRRVTVGFNRRASHDLVDLAECPVLAPALFALVPLLRRFLARLPGGDLALDAVATVLDGGIDLLLVGPPALDLVMREGLAEFAEAADLARLSWRPHGLAAIEPIAWRRPALVRFGETAVMPPPGAFLQASRGGEAALVAAVLDAVGGAARIADLFAGLGTFCFPMAEQGGARILAVDAEGDAVAALAAAARGRSDITGVCRNLFRDPLGAVELAAFDAVVFDPPRAGAAAQATELAGSGVPVVVGVSCSPASFARDARTLASGGYALTGVVPVDQFLWSPHIELVGVFRRTGRAA